MLVFCVSHHLLCLVQFFLCVFHCLLMCDCNKLPPHESLQANLFCKVFLKTKQVFLENPSRRLICSLYNINKNVFLLSMEEQNV